MLDIRHIDSYNILNSLIFSQGSVTYEYQQYISAKNGFPNQPPLVRLEARLTKLWGRINNNILQNINLEATENQNSIFTFQKPITPILKILLMAN